MAQPDSPRSVRKSRQPRRTRRLRKRSWLALFLILLSGCALYSGQLNPASLPPAPVGSLQLSAPAAEIPALLTGLPALREALESAGVDLARVAREHPQATVLCGLGPQPWPAEVARQRTACQRRLLEAADALEQHFAREEGYPATACARCPSGGTVSYSTQAGEFELVCSGAYHRTVYSSLTGFAEQPKPPAPDCAVAVVPPSPPIPWWNPRRYLAKSPPPQVLAGPAQLLPSPDTPGQVELSLRPEVASQWLPQELAGAVRGASHLSLRLTLSERRGQLRVHGPAGTPTQPGDPWLWLARLPEAPVAVAYEREFARSLGVTLREPVRCDPAAEQLLSAWSQAGSGWVAVCTHLDLADWRHERGRLCAGRAAAAGVSPEAPTTAGQGPDLQVQQAADHSRVGLGEEPDGPAPDWRRLAELPGPAGAAGRVCSRQLLVPTDQDNEWEVYWAAGRDSLGLWLAFEAQARPTAPWAAVPTLGPELESLYKRHLTVVAGR